MTHAPFYDRFCGLRRALARQRSLGAAASRSPKSCTYSELRRMAESVGRWITEQHFPPGTRLALVADNHPRWTAEIKQAK